MGKRIIPCIVNNEYVQGAGVQVGAAGSHDDVILELNFSDVWAGLTKSITWLDATGANPVNTILTTNLLKEGELEVYLVPIPAAPKAYAGNMTMTIKGAAVTTFESEVVEAQATLSTSCTFRVLPAAFDGMEVITPTQAEQLQSEIDDIKQDIVDAAAAANSKEEAAASAAAAETAADNAANSASAAAQSAAAAASSKEAAAASAAAAETAADNAANSSSAAAQSAAAAANSKEMAEQGAALSMANASLAGSHAETAKSWAVGGTGTRSGEDTDNAAYYAGQAAASALAASQDAQGAGNSAAAASDSADAAAASAQDAEQAAGTAANQVKSELQGYATAAESAADRAEQAAETAEAIAGGNFIPSSQIGAEGGVASLDNTGKVPAGQLPELDASPQENSIKPVTSGGIYNAIQTQTSALAEHTANTTVHVTEAERTAWNGKADLGEDGKIPAAQLPELNYDLAGEAEDKVSAHNASQTAHSDIRETVQQALSKAAGAAKTEIVAYEGTATYGADNPCSVTFSFAPKLAVMLGQSANGSWWDNVNLHAGTSSGGYASRSYMVAACLPVTSAGATRSGFADSYCKDAYGYKSSDGKTFYWYNEVGASPQCNSSNATYYVLGIG